MLHRILMVISLVFYKEIIFLKQIFSIDACYEQIKLRLKYYLVKKGLQEKIWNPKG